MDRVNQANDLDSFSALHTPEGQALLAELRDHDPADELATATRLRRDHPASLVSAALGQARLRQRAAAKFGTDAARMYFTPNGVEQSTRSTVAAHRATRLAALGVRSSPTCAPASAATRSRWRAPASTSWPSTATR